MTSASPSFPRRPSGDTRNSDDVAFRVPRRQRCDRGENRVSIEGRGSDWPIPAQLRGVVPLMLHLRRPEPALVIPLAGAAGKTFQCDAAEFTIERVDDSKTTTTVVESRCGAVVLGSAYLFPALSVAGASLASPWLRFHIPLIKPDVRFSRIRLSDKAVLICCFTRSPTNELPLRSLKLV